MFDELILSKLESCIEHITAIDNYVEEILSPQEFIKKNQGLNYDAVLMRLQVLGELFKNISKKNPEVIIALNYPEITDIIKFRDFISHHYERLEQEIIFDICKRNIPQLKACITTLQKSNNS